MHNLHHQLARFYSRKYVLTKSFLFHRIGEILCNLVVYVGIKKCLAYVFQRLRHVDFGDFAFTFQNLE